MNIEDCKEGMKVRWEFDGYTDEGIICKNYNSIFAASGNEYDDPDVWVDFSNHIVACDVTSLTPIETKERTYTKEEIVEYLAYKDCHVAVSKIIEGLDEYFSPINNAEREAIKLLKSKGYTVQK